MDLFCKHPYLFLAAPNDWKQKKMLPVFKSGGKQSPYNNGVTLSSSIPPEVTEHIMYYDKVVEDKFAFANQYGFTKKNRSAKKQLATLRTLRSE